MLVPIIHAFEVLFSLYIQYQTIIKTLNKGGLLIHINAVTELERV